MSARDDEQRDREDRERISGGDRFADEERLDSDAERLADAEGGDSDEERLDSDAERLGPEAERARTALRECPPLRANAAFRERLKRDFVSGAIEVTHGKGRRVPASGIASFEKRRRRVPAFVWVGAGLAAAAALVIVFGALNTGPNWWVTAARGEGSILLDGQAVDLQDRDGMRRLLVPGVEIETAGDAELDICSNGVIALQLAPGTRMTLPPQPKRWIGRRMELHARAGEIRFTTGRKFPGVQLAVMSPTAAVEVTGTTFAVIIEESGDCICVFEGEALVGRHRGGEFTDMRSVPSGMRRFVYKDERPSDLADMREEERGKLETFRESQRPWLEGEEPAE